jgi:hypothetical protein
VPVFHFHAEKVVNAVAGFPASVIAVMDEGTDTVVNTCLIAVWVSAGGWYSYFLAAARTLVGGYPYVGGGSPQAATAVDPLDSNWQILPVCCGMTVSGVLCLLFWFSDLWAISSTLQEGCLLPSAAPYQCVVVGDFLLPWTNTVMQTI